MKFSGYVVIKVMQAYNKSKSWPRPWHAGCAVVIHKVASYALFRFFVANKLGHFSRFAKYSDEIYGVWTFVQTRFSLDNRRTVSRVLCVLVFQITA